MSEAPQDIGRSSATLEVADSELEVQCTTLNPILALRRRLAQRNELQEQTLDALAQEAAKRLIEGIAEKGMVSLFHDRETGELITEMYSAFFGSSELQRVHVDVTRNHRRRNEALPGAVSPKISISIIENLGSIRQGKRVAHIVHEWGMADGEYRTEFIRDVLKGDPNKTLSTKEKSQFLQQLIDAEVDETETERKFGAPYTEGGTRSSNRPGDTSVHHAYWVRDIRNQLPPLSSGSSLALDQETETLALNP